MIQMNNDFSISPVASPSMFLCTKVSGPKPALYDISTFIVSGVLAHKTVNN